MPGNISPKNTNKKKKSKIKSLYSPDDAFIIIHKNISSVSILCFCETLPNCTLSKF